MISLIDNDRRWMMIFAPPLVHKLQTLPEGQRTQASLNCNGVLKRCFIAHLKMRTHLELSEEEVSLC